MAAELAAAVRMRLYVDEEDGRLWAVSVTAAHPQAVNAAIDLMMHAGARAVTELTALRDCWGSARWFVDCGDVLYVQQLAEDVNSPGPAVACELKLAGLLSEVDYALGDYSVATLQRELARLRGPERHDRAAVQKIVRDLEVGVDHLLASRGMIGSKANVFPRDEVSDWADHSFRCGLLEELKQVGNLDDLVGVVEALFAVLQEERKKREQG